MINAFYFTLKALFFLKIFKFLSWHFSHVEKNSSIRKIKLISKSMTSQPGWQTIAIHTLPDISIGKGNQAMKFGPLTECNMKNIFIEKSYTKCDGGTIPRPLSEKSRLSISSYQYCKFLNSLFLLYVNLRAMEI